MWSQHRAVQPAEIRNYPDFVPPRFGYGEELVAPGSGFITRAQYSRCYCLRDFCVHGFAEVKRNIEGLTVCYRLHLLIWIQYQPDRRAIYTICYVQYFFE